MTHITCQIPDKRMSPELHDQILMFQNYRCNSYCLRTLKTNNGTKTACRFGFSRPITQDFIFRDVDGSITNSRKLKKKSVLRFTLER